MSEVLDDLINIGSALIRISTDSIPGHQKEAIALLQDFSNVIIPRLTKLLE